MRKNKTEALLKAHYADLLDLNRRFIASMNRPRVQLAETLRNTPEVKKKLTKKQLDALARGRKTLASKRLKVL